METVRDFYFLVLQNHGRQEVKRQWLLGRKAMINLDSMLKSSDITLLTKVRIVKSMVFPVVMYRCESWTIKNAEHWRIDAFELWCWGRLLRVSWTARRSNQSIQRKWVLNIHWKDWCWSWSVSTLATWCKEPIHWKRPWCWERLRATEDGMVEWHQWFNGHEFEQTQGDNEGQGSLAHCSSWGCKKPNMT